MSESKQGEGEGSLVASILLYLPRYKKGWFNKRDVYTLVLRPSMMGKQSVASAVTSNGYALLPLSPLSCLANVVSLYKEFRVPLRD